MIPFIKWYFSVWWKVMTRPILFYAKPPEGEWWQEPLTFVMASSGILALGTTVTIFLNKYLTVGAGLTEGLSALKLLIVSPVILTLAAVFFILTLLITSGFLTLFFAFAFGALGVLLHFTLKLLGGRGGFSETVKACLYSSAIIVLGLVPIFLAVFTQRKLFGFQELLAGEGLVYYMAALYLYGLWSIAGKKIHEVPRWKAFLAAALPAVIIVLIGLALNFKILPKMEPWVT